MIIAAWWALYLLGNLVELGARGGVGNSAPALRDHAEVELVSLGISTAAALLAIAIVVRLTRRQAQKFAALSVQPRVE